MIVFLCLLTAALICSPVNADEASDEWFSLVGERYRKDKAFAFPDFDATLPSVLIYGDSISMGYQPTVREQLAGKANVYRVHCNGGDSASVIEKVDMLHQTMSRFVETGRWPKQWSVIHFNVGLHDLKYLADSKLKVEGGVQVRSAEDYQKEFAEAIDYFQRVSPKAKIVFATTTPVPEHSNGRVAGDAARYNKAAMEVLSKYPSIAINDLYQFTKPNQTDWWTKPGNVHYNSKGKAAQGKEVARVLLEVLEERNEVLSSAAEAGG